ncbi:MAG: hypothetical protein NZO16_00990 [Deltaproteobacteria bacterium]|nr:hypothetical protein [Deltaproteobacteria bacterium]
MDELEIPSSVKKILGAYHTVAEAIRSCYADYMLGEVNFSDFSKFLVKRIMGSNLLFSATRLYAKKYLDSELDSIDDLFRVYAPQILASVICAFYVSRKTLKVVSNEHRAKYGRLITITSEISLTLGKNLKEIGLFSATMHSCLESFVYGVFYLESPENFVERFLIGGGDTYPRRKDEEFSLFRISSGVIVSTVVQLIGFGRKLSEDCYNAFSGESGTGKICDAISTLRYLVGVFLKEEPTKFLRGSSFELEEKAIDAVLLALKNLKESPSNPWFLPEFDGAEFQFQAIEGFDDSSLP